MAKMGRRGYNISIQAIDSEHGLHGSVFHFPSATACAIWLQRQKDYVKNHLIKKMPILTRGESIYAIVEYRDQKLLEEKELIACLTKYRESIDRAIRKQTGRPVKKQVYTPSVARRENDKRQADRKKIKEILIEIDREGLNFIDLAQDSEQMWELRRAYGMTDDEIKKIIDKSKGAIK